MLAGLAGGAEEKEMHDRGVERSCFR
jgi:hypothetical protein